MNHDGHLGTLSIKDSKMDCASSPWCSLVLHYTDGDGNRRNGRIEKIDDRFQHMVFYIDFPGNTQKFDAYLFSWDKSKLAYGWGWKVRGNDHDRTDDPDKRTGVSDEYDEIALEWQTRVFERAVTAWNDNTGGSARRAFPAMRRLP